MITYGCEISVFIELKSSLHPCLLQGAKSHIQIGVGVIKKADDK